MFTICAGESVNISPIAQDKRPVEDSSCQTEFLPSEAKETQMPVKKGKKIQTDISERRKASTSEFDAEQLIQFLNRVTPEVCRYLESNRTSHAFDRYTLLDDADVTSTEKTHCLKNKLPSDEFLCSDVSWNSTGRALAVAYASRKHTAWCDHDSLVCVWNPFRKDFSSEKPQTLIEVDGCVTSIAFHPTLPAVIAGGKFNGTIYIWNIAKEDDMLLANTEAMYSAHREPITSLVWIPDSKHKLVSSGLDGKILVWKYSEKHSSLEMEDGFIVLAEQLARNLGIKSVRPGAEVGVTSLSLNCEDPSIFVIGTEGGGVFQCSFNAKTLVHYPQDQSVQLKSPIEMSHRKNTSGHTTSVQFSPFARNLFLASSGSGEIKIFSTLKADPVVTVRLETPIQKALWSTVRPLVVAAVTVNGNLYIYDLHVSHIEPIEVIPLTDENVGGTTLIFNAANENLLATGCRDGNTLIWKLGSSLISAETYELEELKSLATLDD